MHAWPPCECTNNHHQKQPYFQSWDFTLRMDWMWLGMSSLDCSLRRLLYMWDLPTGNWSLYIHLCSLQSRQTPLTKLVILPRRTRELYRCLDRLVCVIVWLGCFSISTSLTDRTGVEPRDRQLRWTRWMRPLSTCPRAVRCCSATPETPGPSRSSASCCRFSGSLCPAWSAVSVCGFIFFFNLM